MTTIPNLEPIDVVPHHDHDIHSDDEMSVHSSVHPSFDTAEADIVLCSCEEIIFRVHSLILQLASGWFRALLSLPQCAPSYNTSHEPEIIHMVESAKVIAGLLSIASGQSLPPLDSVDYVEDLLHAAEKYDMPSVISIIRLAIVSPSLLDAYPVRVYGIACRWGWLAEAKLASTKTIGCDLLSPELIKDTSTVESPHLAALMLLHRRRRDMLRSGLDSPTQFYANSLPGRCASCQREMSHVAWLHMKQAWTKAIEQSPSDVSSKAVLQQPEIHELLSAACNICLKKLYNAEGTLAKLSGLLDRLPTTVEL